MTHPNKVTVLLTVHNGMPYLTEAVESIVSQTLQEFSFLVIDNGSTDGSGQYLNSIKDNRCHCIHLPRMIKRTDALNKGLRLITTEYTAIIDADDISFPERLAQQVFFLNTHHKISLVGSSIQWIDEAGKSIRNDIFPTCHSELINNLVVVNQFAHAACMFRTKSALSAGGYPTKFSYGQDMALWLAMFQNGEKSASLRQTLAQVRIHPAQATQNSAIKRTRQEEAVQLAKMTLTLPGLSVTARQAGKMRCSYLLFSMGRWKEALKLVGNSFLDAPLLFFFNPYVGKRLFHTVKRKISFLS